MAEKFVYEFDAFSLDPSTRVLMQDGQLTQLRAKPFELLLVLVENGGQSLSKEDLINRVWSGATVTDTNFHVNLDAVRKALAETGRNPRFILRTSGGDRFVGDVKKVAVPIAEQAVRKPDDTHIHQTSTSRMSWWRAEFMPHCIQRRCSSKWLMISIAMAG